MHNFARIFPRRAEHCTPLTRHGLTFSQPSKDLVTPSGVLALTDNLVSPTDLHGFTRIFARAALVLAVRMGKHERSEI